MKEIKNFYLVETKYGQNLMVQLSNGDYYQQVHSTLCMEGGGAATWSKNDIVRGVPLIINPIEKVVTNP